VGNSFEKTVDILIVVVVFFLFPLLYYGLKHDTLTQNVVLAETTEFVDTVRTQGYITKSMYDSYLADIDQTHIIGDIQLEHKKLLLEPEYRINTTEEAPVFTGNVLKYYAKFYSFEILGELYEGSGTYYFNDGDYFSIDISNRSETLGTKLLRMINTNIPDTCIQVKYGGSIRNWEGN